VNRAPEAPWYLHNAKESACLKVVEEEKGCNIHFKSLSIPGQCSVKQATFKEGNSIVIICPATKANKGIYTLKYLGTYAHDRITL
jgi:hypothetical protein